MDEDNIKRELQLTADGSHTLFLPDMDEHYHSVNGAIQESRHIFIGWGLHHVDKPEIRILEIGFGTGLNALLTMIDAENRKKQAITYFSIERYPLSADLLAGLNYSNQLDCQPELFEALHQVPWNITVSLTPHFILHKIEGDSNLCELPGNIDLIYFDAFAPEKQPEMWNQEIFDRLYAIASPGAVIVTYCAKGVVRRMMQSAGFDMQRVPGPPGKRHILFGKKRVDDEA